MKISDEIRNDFFCNDDVGDVAYRQLLCIADRIDREMVELPRGKDGKAIRIGDVVYGEDGRKWLVRGIHYGETKHSGPVHQVHAVDEQRRWRGLKPEWLMRERPDSWERIANDIKTFYDAHAFISRDTLHDFADRIRKLVEKKGEHATD